MVFISNVWFFSFYAKYKPILFEQKKAAQLSGFLLASCYYFSLGRYLAEMLFARVAASPTAPFTGAVGCVAVPSRLVQVTTPLADKIGTKA